MSEAAPVQGNDHNDVDGGLKLLKDDGVLKPADNLETFDVDDQKVRAVKPVYRPPVRPPVSGIRPGGNSAGTNYLQTGLLILTFLLFFAAR